MRLKSLPTLIAVVVLASPSMADAAEWIVAPYLWASDVKLDAKINDVELGGEASFNDLVDKVDTAFMGHFEGRGEKWGAFLDVVYLDLSDTSTRELGPGGPLLGTATTDIGLTLGIYEAVILYRINNAEPGSDAIELDLFAGARMTELDAPASISIQTILPDPIVLEGAIDKSFTDFLIGGRLNGYFNDRWSWNIRADYSAGDSEGIFNTHAMIGYTFGEGLFTLTGGYRYMNLSMEDSDGDTDTAADINMAGPLVGFVFKF